jgi:hypothetical protein
MIIESEDQIRNPVSRSFCWPQQKKKIGSENKFFLILIKYYDLAKGRISYATGICFISIGLSVSVTILEQNSLAKQYWENSRNKMFHSGFQQLALTTPAHVLLFPRENKICKRTVRNNVYQSAKRGRLPIRFSEKK